MSILEYCTSVWSPHLKHKIQSIDSVQKNYTKHVCTGICCNIHFSSYLDRLYKLNLKSLEYRRLEFDLISTYKICCQLKDINFHAFFTCAKSGYNLRRRTFLLRCKYKPKHALYCNFYTHRIISVWNLLPKLIVIASSLDIFKKQLKKFDLHMICN